MCCMSGSVLMSVRIPKTCSCICRVPHRMILCAQCVSQNNKFVHLLCIPRAVVPTTVHRAPKFGFADIQLNHNVQNPTQQLVILGSITSSLVQVERNFQGALQPE